MINSWFDIVLIAVGILGVFIIFFLTRKRKNQARETKEFRGPHSLYAIQQAIKKAKEEYKRDHQVNLVQREQENMQNLQCKMVTEEMSECALRAKSRLGNCGFTMSEAAQAGINLHKALEGVSEPEEEKPEEKEPEGRKVRL